MVCGGFGMYLYFYFRGSIYIYLVKCRFCYYKSCDVCGGLVEDIMYVICDLVRFMDI